MWGGPLFEISSLCLVVPGIHMRACLRAAYVGGVYVVDVYLDVLVSLCVYTPTVGAHAVSAHL